MKLLLKSFLDLQNVFDKVDHEILLTKLSFKGVRGLEIKWFYSFLKQGKKYVFISGFLSDTRTVKCGVQQGSTLGPLLIL